MALIAYPAIFILVFDWAGAGPRWGAKHHSYQLPPDLKAKEEARGRPFLLLKFAILFLALLGLARGVPQRIAPIVSHSRPWPELVASGIAGAVLMLACRRLISL